MPYKSFKDQKRYGFQMPVMSYKPEYCEDMIKLMAKGASNLELAAKFGITEKCFYDWKLKHPDFKMAWDIGYPKCFNWWMTEGKERFFMAGNDKGMKYWQTCMRNMFNFGSEEQTPRQLTTNNIQIGNMNVLANKTDVELLEILNTKLGGLKLPVIEGEIEQSLLNLEDTSKQSLLNIGTQEDDLGANNEQN